MDQFYKCVLASRPRGQAVPANFRIEEDVMPVPDDQQVAVRTLYLSLDPYMRGRMNAPTSYSSSISIGDVMEGEALAEVVESRHPEFKVGDIIRARTGWRTHAVVEAGDLVQLRSSRAPLTTSLGVLGMPGFVAYYDELKADRTSARETLLTTLRRSVLIRGFVNTEFEEQHYDRFFDEIEPLVADGSIKYREEIVDGLEAAPEAFVGMLHGRNFGKLLVNLSKPSNGSKTRH